MTSRLMRSHDVLPCCRCHAVGVGALRLRFAVERGAPSLNALLGSLEAKDCRGRGIVNAKDNSDIFGRFGWRSVILDRFCLKFEMIDD